MKRFYLIFILAFSMLFGFGITANNLQAQEKIAMESSFSNIQIYVVSNKLVVENLPKDKEGVLEIFSIVGVKVHSEKVKNGTNEYNINLPKGYYIVKIGNIVKKVAVK